MSTMKVFILLVCSVDVLFSLRCSTSFPARCQFNSTCEYGIETCRTTSESEKIRGGVYCTTLVNCLSEMLIETMGCMYDQETSKSCLNQSQCRMKFTNQQETFLHCCCNQDFCNQNLNLSNPELKTSSSSNVSLEDEGEDRLFCRSSLCPRRMSLLIIVLCLTLSIVVFAFVVHRRHRSSKSFFKWICQSMKKKKKKKPMDTEKDKEEDSSMLDVEEEEEEEEEVIDRSSLEKTCLIRQGRCCEIYSGCFGEERKEVALKIFNRSLENPSIHFLFQREKEIYSLPQFSHENLLKYFGSSLMIEDRNECLILQLAHRGSLKDFLREHRIDDEQQLITMAQQMSNALEYLHQDFSSSSSSIEKEKKKKTKKRRGETRFPVAHRDLKSENILLDIDGRVMLADFAMSIEIDREHVSSSDHQQVGTPRYMSPEILAGTIGNEWNALLKCDIYALAIVFWELLSRLNTLECNPVYEMPYEEQLLERNLNRNPSVREMSQIVLLESPFNRPRMKSSWRTTSSSKLNLFIQTIEQSWDQLPEARISAALVAHRLRQL